MRARDALTAASLAALAFAATACASAEPPTVGLRAAPVGPTRTVATAEGPLTLFEIEISNRGEHDALLEEALAGPDAPPIAASDLALLLVPRVRVEPARRLLLPAGARTALLCRETSPARPLRREIVASGTNEQGFPVRGRVGTDVPASADAATVLGPPVEGGGWLLENGPATDSGHRRAIVWIARTPRAAQRFAVDFFRVDGQGRTSSGPRAEDHFAFGASVLAVADGVVAAAVDGIPDNAPGPNERAIEMSHATVAGNHVVLDLGGGRFVMAAHLRQGSVAVRRGDRVARGSRIGAIGNSGNSTEPHLHLHVADAPSPVDADGLPFVFETFRAGRGGEARQFAGVLPAEGSVVEFPSGRDSRATSGAPQAAETR